MLRRGLLRSAALFVATLLVSSSESLVADSEGSGPSGNYEGLKQSVLRILTYRTDFKWSRPYNDQESSGSVGSGFLVSVDPPLIVTCAHVVEDADSVDVQVTGFGQTRFAAVVATINNDNDIAILQLLEPKKAIEMLSSRNVTLRALKLAQRTPTLGHEVVAPGFPLGQATLKLSTGVISGVDHVQFNYMNLALQSTAIISSGNSGSPLLDAHTQEVVGMNYARNPKEAQINYAVPLWKLNQVIMKHREIHSKPFQSMPYQLKMVKHGLVVTPGQDVFYMRATHGKFCGAGLLITDIYHESPFNDAKPAVRPDSFLVSIDGVALDRYGQGSKPSYVDELVDFEDLIWMRGGTGDQNIMFETCSAQTGEVLQHSMDLEWQDKRQGTGIQHVYEPRVEHVDWEIFGDLLFMDLTENHIQLLSGEYHDWALVRFLEPEERRHPRLAVMIHREGGDAEEALGLSEGYNLAIVDTINGVAVSDLSELRANLIPRALKNGTKGAKLEQVNKQSQRLLAKLRQVNAGGENGFLSNYIDVLDKKDFLWNLKTTVGTEFSALFLQTLKTQVQDASYGYTYFMTPGVSSAAETFGLAPAGGSSASLLEEKSGRAPARVSRKSRDMYPSKLFGEPLEVVRREGKHAVVDFAAGEGFMRW